MEPFIDFLRGFWSFDSSAYVREKIAHGQRITRRHCIDMRGRIKHWEADFASSHLGEITRKQLSDFGVSLSQKGLAPASINKIITAGAVALRWAFENEMIPTNPAAGLKTFSGFAHKRGILEPEEVRALFATEWEDERAKVACLTAATTGLRMGEILALRPSDVGVDRLYVRHSWGITEGLKCPKNGEEREVPLLPGMRESLLSLASRNPHKVGDAGFIFFGRYPDRPLDANRILFGMRKALVSMDGVSWVDVDSRKALDLPRFRGEVVKPLSLIPPRAA
jgi:integrase